ncbi:cation:H+ antiporter [Lachnospiraceae bacterium XBB1006]|jgi:cation:H+ antiporter|nr:cation:H+ antiporter [Lachnospiraceae bacterium XBB1006]
MDYVLLVIGFILLIKGADFFVEGSASVARKLKVPSFIIGMTIVAMGTSAPECAVSVTASLKNSNALAISNVVGSNIFNLMVVCGVCALLVPLTIDMSTLKREFPFSILVGLLLLGFGAWGMKVGHIDGIVLLVIFALFLFVMVKDAMKHRKEAGQIEEAEEEEIKILPMYQCIFYILIGVVAIVGGGDLVVDSASEIARQFGMSQTLIGLTIVACGTSLPELVTSFVAARKNEVDMALGNVIGSNIFNILLIIGIAATISPIAVTMENIIDLSVMSAMSLLVYVFTLRDQKIGKMQGALMLLVYVGYIVYTCVR